MNCISVSPDKIGRAEREKSTIWVVEWRLKRE
jgi:hypothetical protein